MPVLDALFVAFVTLLIMGLFVLYAVGRVLVLMFLAPFVIIFGLMTVDHSKQAHGPGLSAQHQHIGALHRGPAVFRR